MMPLCPSPLPAQGLLHNPAPPVSIAGAGPEALCCPAGVGLFPFLPGLLQTAPAPEPVRAMPGCCSAGAPDRSGVGCLGGCWCWWWGVGRALRANCCFAGDTEGVIMGGLHEPAAWPGSPRVPLPREWRGSGSTVQLGRPCFPHSPWDLRNLLQGESRTGIHRTGGWLQGWPGRLQHAAPSPALLPLSTGALAAWLGWPWPVASTQRPALGQRRR